MQFRFRTIDDPLASMDQFAKLSALEFRYVPAALGELRQALDCERCPPPGVLQQPVGQPRSTLRSRRNG